MSKPPIDDTRRHLGELGAMAAHVEQSERKILEHAEKMLTEVEAKLSALRAKALAGDGAASQAYQDAIAERGRLNQVIAQARANLPN